MILVLDNECYWTEKVRQGLTKDGFVALTASSQEDATRLLATEPVAVVLLGRGLDDAQRSQLMRTIRSMPSAPSVVVLPRAFDTSSAANRGDSIAQAETAEFSPAKLIEMAMLFAEADSERDWLAAFCARHGFSQRESQVLRLAVGGMQNKEIANRLDCALSTVVSYWKRIYRKTNSSNRTETLAAFIRHQSERREACTSCTHWSSFFENA